MNVDPTAIDPRIEHALSACAPIEVAWLYGSRATGRQHDGSDYDLAVALAAGVDNADLLLDDLQHHLNLQLTQPVSIVDINRAPIPLALNIINQGRVIICRSDFRLRAEQQRVWSLWEEYKYNYEQC